MTFQMAGICVVLGSVREGRMGLRIARYGGKYDATINIRGMVGSLELYHYGQNDINQLETEGARPTLLDMIIIIISSSSMIQIIVPIRMITKQLEKEGAKPTLLDPLEVGAPLLAQPLHFMVSFLSFWSYRD